MNSQDLRNRFEHHPPVTPGRGDAHAEVRARCLDLALELNKLLPEGREKEIAVDRLEETMYWSNAAIAREPGTCPGGC